MVLMDKFAGSRGKIALLLGLILIGSQILLAYYQLMNQKLLNMNMMVNIMKLHIKNLASLGLKLSLRG